MRQEDYSPKQTAAMKARVRRMREQYRRRLIAAMVIFFILGAVAGVFAHRWYVDRTPTDTLTVTTPEPTAATQVTLAPQVTPEAWDMSDSGQPSDEEDDIFPESGEDGADSGAELDAFPEVDSQQLTEDGDAPDEAQQSGETGLLIAPGEKLEPQPGATVKAVETQAPDGEAGDAQPEEAADAADDAEAEAADLEANDAEAGDAGTGEAGEAEDAGTEEAEEAEAPAEQEEAVEAAATQDLGYGPQVVAIVPYGESFTYTTEINADGNARVEATNEPYETICFTQSMKKYMRPTDYAEKYATQYKMQGNEAGASFELTLIDYIGNTTIVPQNVVDVSLRSESGNTVEHGYQLMDAEIDGKYGIALPTNTPTTFYKRFAYPADGEDMKYLVITTYKNGQTQMILFELESEKPPEPEVIYPTLQRGLVNDDVLNLQNRLAELGYLNVTPDGTFGPKTEEAIKAAQAAFGMEANGIADNAFQQKLFEGAAPNVGEATGYVTLSDGSTGEAVVRLQKRLAELGYYSGKADGGYGPKMVAAVKKAQADFGMEQTGTATSEFQRRAFANAVDAGDGESGLDTGYTVLQKGSKGDAVVKLQLALREQGYYSGKADGGYGPMMVQAVKAAQAAFGLEQTGIADVAFQQHLYGSVTAPTEAPTEAPEAAADEEG
ncbi:MAG: peptidoglycan-binding protein [Clostridia bacterium]|nr:peptidoglycan-binding protein [Clostridia bacterium]